MFQTTRLAIGLALFAVATLDMPAPSWGRGFGGGHSLGGGGALAGRGLGGGGLADRGLGGGGLGGRGLPGGLGGGGLAGRPGGIGSLSGLDGGPARGALQNFRGLPSDNGLHNLSGETQSRLSQAYDRARDGDGPQQNDFSRETQSRLSQLYDNVRSGDGPFSNFIPGETQSLSSRVVDRMRAGDGPFSHFIPGETEKLWARIYHRIINSDHPLHPLHPIHPWDRHNNGVVIRRNFNNYFLFTPGWYQQNAAAWSPNWAYGNAWQAAGWPMLRTWLGYPASSQPISYNYGDNVTYSNGSIYADGQEVGTLAEYYQEALQLAQSGDNTGDEAGQQWMPLGVFALTENGQTTANLLLQLAVNNKGIIRGTLTNTNTSQNQLVQGAVDLQTERAAWTVGDNTKTVFDTGLYNLTKDETSVIVHDGPDQIEQDLLVRLTRNDQKTGQAPAQSPTVTQ